MFEECKTNWDKQQIFQEDKLKLGGEWTQNRRKHKNGDLYNG